MRINPSQLNAYARHISPHEARAGSVVDVTGSPESVSPAQPVYGPHPGGEVGAIRGVLTSEETRFIANLFPGQNGQDEGVAKAGHPYTRAARPAGRSIPGVRLDMKA